jgi:hypothetical protein
LTLCSRISITTRCGEKTECREQLGQEIAPALTRQEYFRVHVEKQPAVGPERVEIAHMHGGGEPVQRKQVGGVAAKGVQWRNRRSTRIGRAYQAFKSDRAAVRHAEYRLEMAA